MRRLIGFVAVLCIGATCALAKTKRPRYEVVGYVLGPQTGVLDPSTIAAAKMTRINYAFFRVKDGVIVQRRDNDAANLIALMTLKKTNPQLQILVSVGGGGNGSAGFSDMAITEAGRKRFIDSAVTLVEKYGLDGIDIDWEYPGYTHAQNTNVRPEDKQTYTLLLKELRQRLDKEQKKLKRPLVTSSATGATQKWLDNTDMRSASKWLTSVNMMCYDWYSASAKNTGHDSPLYTNPKDPKAISIDNSVRMYLAAGVSKKKLIIGVPFYGRIWTGVDATNHGLWQPIPVPGKDIDFKDIVPLVTAPGYIRYWDATAQAPYLYNAQTKTFVTYNDAEAEAERTAYVRKKGLGGIMFWQYGGDPQNVLLNAIDAGFAQ
ncbi:MAG TPA: glycoside hydrolase family 18 protein [Edaphobacter sp.]|nr:glycoside hydrolase family 18 protein [Edaphobacter sp.]